VEDEKQRKVFSFCNLDKKARNPPRCGPNCGEDRCCAVLEFQTGALVCVDSRVCAEGVRRGQGSFLYGDYTAYTGEEIPPPSDCALSITAIKTCAPGCQQCGSGEICTGRSPSHPLGICFPGGFNENRSCAEDASNCPLTDYCFSWGHSNNKLSDGYEGACVPKDACLQLAQYLPGGGHCTDEAGNPIDP
jgi:hypothetical protein